MGDISRACEEDSQRDSVTVELLFLISVSSQLSSALDVRELRNQSLFSIQGRGF
jgi:hypothetical protein